MNLVIKSKKSEICGEGERVRVRGSVTGEIGNGRWVWV